MILSKNSNDAILDKFQYLVYNLINKKITRMVANDFSDTPHLR